MRLPVIAVLLLVLGVQASTLPRIGLLEFYGLKEVKRETLASLIGVNPGDPMPVNYDPGVADDAVREAFDIPKGAPLPPSEREIIRRLKSVSGVTDAKLAGVCCEPDGTATVFVGIQERTEPPFEYKKARGKSIKLPLEILSLYDESMETLAAAVRKGTASEDDSEGHALFADAKLREFTGKFLAYAREHTLWLAEVMNESSDAPSRAAAAWIIGYAPDKGVAARELLKAIHDENEQVRNNATRSLAPIITFSQSQPELGIQIEPGIFIRMLHSLSWTDRNKATMVLLSLTKPRPREVLKALHDRALEPLIEMANWQDSHNRMALLLLARIAGISDDEAADLKKRHRLIASARDKKF